MKLWIYIAMFSLPALLLTGCSADDPARGEAAPAVHRQPVIDPYLSQFNTMEERRTREYEMLRRQIDSSHFLLQARIRQVQDSAYAYHASQEYAVSRLEHKVG